MNLKKRILIGVVAAAFAGAAAAQMMYGNTFPFWNVTGALDVGGASTLRGGVTVTGSTVVTGAASATTSLSAPIVTTTGYQKFPSPRTITAASDTPTAADSYLIANVAGTVTLTLDPTNTGRRLCVKTIQAQTVVSAASDVAPAASGTAGTAILAGTAGKFACMVSNGTAYVIMESN